MFIIFVLIESQTISEAKSLSLAGNSGVSGWSVVFNTIASTPDGSSLPLAWLSLFRYGSLHSRYPRSSSAFIQHSRITTPRRVTVTSAVVGSKGHDSASGFTFDEIKSIESRLEIIEREAPDLLVAYYEPHYDPSRSSLGVQIKLVLRVHALHYNYICHR